VEHTQREDHHSGPVHQHWLSRKWLLIANGAFAIYATALAVDTGHADRTWAIWAAVGYGVTTLILWLTRHKNVPVIVPQLVALVGALVAILWGRDARSLVPLLSGVGCIESAHPSPYSATGGFFGSRPFSKANKILEQQGAEPVDWKLP